jgi:hypothetical protein
VLPNDTHERVMVQHLNGPILFERESQRVYTTWQMVRLYNKTLFAWNAAIRQMTAETTVMVSVFWDVLYSETYKKQTRYIIRHCISSLLIIKFKVHVPRTRSDEIGETKIQQNTCRVLLSPSNVTCQNTRSRLEDKNWRQKEGKRA